MTRTGSIILAIIAHLAAVVFSVLVALMLGVWLLSPFILFLATVIAGGLLLRLSKPVRVRDLMTGAAVAALFVSLGLYVIDWAAATADDRIRISEFVRYLAHPPRMGDAVLVVAPLVIMCPAVLLALLFRRRQPAAER